MKKLLSIIYQYYLLKEFTYSYLDALFTIAFLIIIHIFILKELLIKLVSIKNNPPTVLLQIDHFSPIFGLGIVLFLSIFYGKKKLLEIKYPFSDLKIGIQKLLIYFSLLFIFLIILQIT